MQRPAPLAATLLVVFTAVMHCGCVKLGPKTVARDRFEYGTSIAESWKRQVLLNIVKFRYLDPPIFVDVGQIVAGYSIEGTIGLGATESSDGTVQGDFFSLGAGGRYVDRPTITYTPLTGSRFVQGLMTPFRPEAVFAAIQAGWPADAILFAAVASMNGLRNMEASVSKLSPAEPGFLRALELLRKLQQSGAVAFRIRKGEVDRPATIVTFRSSEIDAETFKDVAELRALLKLDPDASEIQLVQGFAPSHRAELAVQTRSILHIMASMAAEVDVPPEHVSEERAWRGWTNLSESAPREPLIRIHATRDPPDDGYASVPYRDHWFWIDDRDLRSKRTFSLLMMLFTLTDTGEPGNLPLITIPAQ